MTHRLTSHAAERYLERVNPRLTMTEAIEALSSAIIAKAAEFGAPYVHMAHGVGAARCGKVRQNEVREAGSASTFPPEIEKPQKCVAALVLKGAANLRQTCGKVRQQEGLCRTSRGTPKGVSPDWKCGTSLARLLRCGTFHVTVSEPWPMWAKITTEDSEIHSFRSDELYDLKHLIDRAIAAVEAREAKQ